MSTPVPEWPTLAYADWAPTRRTLHLVTQIAAKLRARLVPSAPRHLELALALTSRGITTGPLPLGDRSLEMRLDLIGHRVVLERSDGPRVAVELPAAPCVADIWAQTVAGLAALDVPDPIRTLSPQPFEGVSDIPMDRDRAACAYDPQAATRFFSVLTAVHNVFLDYRAPWMTTTTLSFWSGSFDLSLERWREAPPEPVWDADVGSAGNIDLEYVVAGFWPGDERFPEPAFYSFTEPAPAGYAAAQVEPEAAGWSEELGEFLLRYDDVRAAPDARTALLDFLRSTCEAGRSEEW